MDETPAAGKRNRSDASTPEIDDAKRQCNISAGLIDSSIMEDPNNEEVFHDKLLNMLQRKEVLAVICSIVAETIRPMFREEMESLVDKNIELEATVADLNQKIDDQREEISALGDRLDKNIELEATVADLNQKIDDQRAEINALGDRLDRSDQYSRRNNLRISGIPEEEGEDTDAIITEVAKSIGLDITSRDIDASHRVPRRPSTPQERSRPILVRFVSNATQRLLLKSRSKLKTVIRAPSTPKVFINEDLTRARADLARQARDLVSKGRFESSWVTRGVILIKLKDGSVKKVANSTHFEEVMEATELKMTISLSQQQEK